MMMMIMRMTVMEGDGDLSVELCVKMFDELKNIFDL